MWSVSAQRGPRPGLGFISHTWVVTSPSLSQHGTPRPWCKVCLCVLLRVYVCGDLKKSLMGWNYSSRLVRERKIQEDIWNGDSSWIRILFIHSFIPSFCGIRELYWLCLNHRALRWSGIKRCNSNMGQKLEKAVKSSKRTPSTNFGLEANPLWCHIGPCDLAPGQDPWRDGLCIKV